MKKLRDKKGRKKIKGGPRRNKGRGDKNAVGIQAHVEDSKED